LISDVSDTIYGFDPDPRSLKPMRAETEAVVAEIKQSVGLLRRHL
jgi:hypothetical protein